MTQKKSGLGRNLNVLLGSRVDTKKLIDGDSADMEIINLGVDDIQPGAFQPRKQMDEEALQELSASIKQQGLLQPIAVRRITPDKYEIIAGERRFRAAKLAKLTKIPAIVHHIDDKTTLAYALVENIQREDLNPLEEAIALSRLIEEFQLTHQQAADLLSKSRANISNLLRLLNLAPGARALLEAGRIEMGHARALLSLEPALQDVLAKKIISLSLNVRETEALVRKHQDKTPVKTQAQANPLAALYSDKLQSLIGLPVNVQSKRGGKHRIVIDCKSDNELETLLTKFGEDD